MTHREFRRLFPEFDAASWAGWNRIEDALFGVAPDDPVLVQRLLGGRPLPTAPVSEGWFVVARGAGKSRIAARLACYFAAGREYRRVPGEHVYVGVFGPDRRQAALTFRYVRGLLRSVPALSALIVRESAESVELSTGVVIEVITASTAAPRGRAYALVIVEEAAFLPVDEQGADTDRELLRAVRPALARVPGSLLLVISSPYAMRGELYRVWRERYGVDDPAVVVLQADTATLNPTFSAREIQRAYVEDPESAAAEYGGQFRANVTDLFGPALAAAVDEGVRERPPVAGQPTFWHFDGATGSGEDDAALAGAELDDVGGARLVAYRRWSPPFSPLAVVQEAQALLRRYGADDLQIDRFAPGLFADLFAARAVTCRVSPLDTSATFLELLAHVNAGTVRLLDDEVLLAQLRGLERRTRSGGRDVVGHRPHSHDDVAAAAGGALIQAVRAATEVPLMLLGTDTYRAWSRAHGIVQPDVGPTPQAVKRPSLAARALDRVSESWSAITARRRAVEEVIGEPAPQARPPRLLDVAKAVLRGAEHDAHRAGATWAAHQQEQDEQRRQRERHERAAKWLAERVRRNGSWFPSDL